MANELKSEKFTLARVLAEEIRSIKPGSAFQEVTSKPSTVEPAVGDTQNSTSEPSATETPSPEVSVPETPISEAASVEDLRRENFLSGASALCLSGGGIRSAAFSLGVVEGLAKRGYLHKFDYLFTVSGGGYTGSMLAAWVYRAYGGIREVVDGLRDPTGAPADPLCWLRRYTKYLSPRLGVFSLDTWTLVATYLRNLFLNWLILLPLLGLIVAIPFIFFTGITWVASAVSYFEEFRDWLSNLAMILGLILVTVASYCLRWRTSFIAEDMRTEKRIGYDGFIVGGTSIGVCFIALGWHCHTQLNAQWPSLTIPIIIVATVIAQFLAFLLFFFTKDDEEWRKEGWFYLFAGFILSAILFGILLLLCGQLFTKDVIAQYPRVYYSFAPSALILCVVLAEIVFAGVSSKASGDFHREWWSRIDAELLQASVGWAMLATMVLLLPHWLANLKFSAIPASWWQETGSIILIALFGGGLTRIAFLSGMSVKREEDAKVGIVARYLEPAISLFSLVFIVLLFAWLAARYEDTADFVSKSLIGATGAALDMWSVLIVAAGLLLALLAFSKTINVNRFSLHAMYRERLIRAFLGGSRANHRESVIPSSEREKLQFEERKENIYTDFDPVDNPKMAWLRPGREVNGLPATDVKRPFLVINCAINLVATKNLAWQERKAASFTISPLHAGCSNLESVGYCDTGDLCKEAGGITLGTALTISGAAVSPNAGYHSRPLITFLMTLFNARLGWWLGKPANPKVREKDSPENALRPMFSELFGRTHDGGDWVYLSDGGHFDNLGLYEAVQRGCKYIVVVDGSADPERKFDDLGNAIRKIRVDLGIPVERRGEWLVGGRERAEQGRYCAVFALRYEASLGTLEPGWLIYIKSAIYPYAKSMVPTDVLNYAMQSPQFPHEPTGQQFFGEAQFESYRALGEHEIATMMDPFEDAEDFDDLVHAAIEHATFDDGKSDK